MLTKEKGTGRGRRLLVLLLAVVLLLSVVPMTQALAADDTYDVGEYKGDKEQNQWTYPTQEGKVFAGWYQDADFETPYTETTGEAYAKFVDDDLMSVKKQLNTGATLESETVKIRFVTPIDSLDYASVTFDVKVPTLSKIWTMKETTAYSSILVSGETTLPSDVFGSEAKYFVLHSLTGIPKAAYEAAFEVNVTWETLDGTLVVSTQADTFTVNELLGGSSGVATIVGKQSYNTLEDAVSNAVDGDVIQINGDYIANNEIAISDKSITITSEADAAYTITRGTSLTANAVFVVNDGAGLTLTNITVDGNGTAAADNVKPLVDNLGVFTLSADAALTNNVNTSNGGGLFNRGSGISHIYGTISNCSAENGGAMRVNAGTVNIYDGAKISGNAAGSNGGGIHANGGTVNVYKAEFNGNEAANVSGAIHIGGATVNIDGAVFTSNSADKQGGISYINKGKTLTISNITATGNTSPEGNAFYIAANTVLTLSDCNIVSASGTNIVLNNQALHVSGTSVLGNVTLNGNTIHLTGELATGSDITIIPASYTEGTVVVTEEVAGLLENAVQYIRVAEVSGADWVVTAEGTLDNQAYVVSLGTNKYQTVAEAISAAVSGDTVTLLTSVSEATVTVPAGVTLDGGDYTITGDIVLADGGLMKNINITGNVTVQGNGDLTTAKVSGKVTVSAGKSVTVGAGFDADTVELKSGATIKLDAALASDATVKVTAEQTAEGTVILTGDASLIAAESGKFKLESADSTLQLGSDGKIEKIPFKAIIVGKQEYDKLEDAVANAEDGDVIQITDNYTVNSQINIEKAITITGAEGITPVILCGSRTNGSAVFNVTGSLTLENITVDGNGLACNRAMVINAGTFTLAEDATLTNAQNITSRPSALDNQDNANAKAYIYGTISNCSGAYTAVENRAKATLVIGDGATFKGNTQTNTKYGGGAVYNSGTLTVGAATFENNTAAGNGGAIYSKTAVTITGAAFTGNTAANGGALYLGGEATHALTSCVFNNNTATGDGQAVYAYKCTLTMSGCTINSSEEITDEDVKLDNSTMN